MKDTSGTQLIAIAGVMAAQIAECFDDVKELHMVSDFLGLLRHNIDIIRHRGHHRHKHTKEHKE